MGFKVRTYFDSVGSWQWGTEALCLLSYAVQLGLTVRVLNKTNGEKLAPLYF